MTTPNLTDLPDDLETLNITVVTNLHTGQPVEHIAHRAATAAADAARKAVHARYREEYPLMEPRQGGDPHGI